MHRSGKGRDLENGSLTRVMGSLYSLNHQFCGRYGLFLAQQKRAVHCAGNFFPSTNINDQGVAED
jgi:hypothetical protein